MTRKKRRIKFLEKKDVDAIISSITGNEAQDVRDRAILEVLFSTGMRVSEALGVEIMQYKDLHDTGELSIVGKGGWSRPVYFSPSALRAVDMYLEKREDRDSRLFPLTPRSVQLMVKRRASGVGLRATPHTFRHSMATHALRSGANLRVVQELLGHQNLSNTAIYAGVTNRDLQEAHKKMFT